MPSRTIKQSHRPRVSHRTMHCHSWSGQSSGLLFQKTMGAVTNSEMEPQGKTIASPSRTETRQNPLPGEDHSQSKRHVQTVGLNAETKKGPASSRGGRFVLTFPLIGPFRFPNEPATTSDLPLK